MVTDPITDLNAWFAAIADNAGYAPPGTYDFGTNVFIHGNTTVYGAGQGSFRLNNTAAGQAVLINANPSTDAITDCNIAIYGTAFTSNPIAAPVHDNLCFTGVKQLTLRDCLLYTDNHDAILLANVHGFVVDGCEFTSMTPYAPPPPKGTPEYSAWCGGNAVFAWGWCTGGRVVNNRMTGMHGGGIWLPVTDSNATGSVPGPRHVAAHNIIDGAVEFGIVAGDDCLIDDNFIARVIRVDVSGHGAELHGTGVEFTHNIVRDCDGAGLFFFNPRQVQIAGNIFSNCNKLGETFGACVVIDSAPASMGMGSLPPSRVRVTGNTFIGGNGQRYAIVFGNLTFGALGHTSSNVAVITNGDYTALFPPGCRAVISESSGNNGSWPVVQSSFDAATNQTTLQLATILTHTTNDGLVVSSTTLLSDIDVHDNDYGKLSDWAVAPIGYYPNKASVVGTNFKVQ